MARGTTLPAPPTDRTRRLMEVRHGLAGDARAARVAVEDARHAVGEAALAQLLDEGDEGAVQIAEGRLAAAERERLDDEQRDRVARRIGRYLEDWRRRHEAERATGLAGRPR